MPAVSVWEELIKPTIFAFVLSCAIPGVIAGCYYVFYKFF